jgi:tetratricopeptide (TPR) repeat protein
MQLLKNERFANRVMLALGVGLVLMVVGWVLRGSPTPEAARPQVGALVNEYFAEAEARGDRNLDRRITKLQQRLTAKPDDWQAYSELGLAYLQKARETADPAYYQKAETSLQQTVLNDPGNYPALGGLGELALARHDFARALELGTQARNLNPNRSYAYGVIADAQIELGRYDEAVETLQAMVDLRPDLSSYSRISYLRELNGDVDGAIEAMQLAVDAGGPTAENTFWTRTQLGHLYFNSGQLNLAEIEYQRLLALDPSYVHALAGLARVRAAQGRYAEAIGLYRVVTTHAPLADYVIAFGEVYAASGDTPAARQQFELARAIDQLHRAQGVNTDLELALFLADHGTGAERAEAVTRAHEGYAQRPTVHAADVLAWALYQTGQYTEAQSYSQRALRLGTQDALKFFHAGMIEYKLGNAAGAQDYLRKALTLNPHFSLHYAQVAQHTLAQLAQEP